MKFTSRERPKQLIDCVQKYLDLASDTSKMIFLFTFDASDPTVTEEFCKTLPSPFKRTFISVTQGENQNKIEAINRDIDGLPIHWDILLNISDDQLPQVKGYDDIIRTSMPDDLDASLWFHDGWQKKINTQEILGRKYYSHFNHVYYPGYKSFFCDNEATEIAAHLGKIRIFSECIVKHFHPGWDRSLNGKRDDLYIRNDQHWNHDEELYKRRKVVNFGL